MASEFDWDTVIDAATGWLIPGVHEVENEDIFAEFVSGQDARRTQTWDALLLLLGALKDLIPSGRLLIAGTFVSRQTGPVEPPLLALVPDDPSTLGSWTDADEARFLRYQSLYDLIVGSLGPDYIAVLNPLGGLLEVTYCEPDDVEQFVSFMGAVTLSDGSEIKGARGVVEVVW